MTSAASAPPLARPAASAWLPPARRAGAGPVVVCLAPAGAGAGFFRDWPQHLAGLRIAPVQLPGREERFGEPPREDAAAIATDIAAAIEAEGWEAVTLLGYSYGALLAFETACALEASARCRVSGLVACARAAPQTAPLETVADGPDADLLAHVRRLGGLPPEIDAAPEFLELLLPVLRADFRANDRYAAAPDRRIAAPIATVAGTDDPATAAGRDRAWADRTHGPHRLFRVAGGHFFVNGPTGATAGFQAIAAAIAHVAGQSPAADAKGRQ